MTYGGNGDAPRPGTLPADAAVRRWTGCLVRTLLRHLRLPWRALAVGRARSADRLRPTVAGIPQRRIRANPVPALRACVRGSDSINVGSESVSHGSQHFPVGPETTPVGWRSTRFGPLRTPFRRRVLPVAQVLVSAELKTRSLGSELVAARRLGRHAAPEFACAGRSTG